MAFCQFCGTRVEENATFCGNCGARMPVQAQTVNNVYSQPVAPQMPTYTATYNEAAQSPASGQLNVGMLVFSIIIIVFGNWILGLIALILTITAKDAATAEEEKKKLKTAKTLNVISVALLAFAVVITIILLVVGTGAAVASEWADYLQIASLSLLA